MQLDESKHPKTMDAYQTNADLGSLSIHWVFLLSFKPSQDQLTRINTYFYTPYGWEDNLGRNFYDFTGIIDRITLHVNEARNLQLKLALDLQNYKAIFKDQKNRGKIQYLNRISNIYLFSFNNDAPEIKKIQVQNKLIDRQVNNLSDFLDKHYKEIMNQEINKKLLPNFNILGFQKSERFSDERRLKIYAFMKLSITEYPKYLQKCKNSLQKYKHFFDSRDDETVKELSAAIVSLAKDHKKAFYRRMLALYQKQSSFYHILNLYLKKCADPKFLWDEMALPICLMFKAIKFYFHDADNREEINKLFDSNGVCVLWRGAKFDQSQLNDMLNSQRQQHVYYQQVSITSTSIKREVAENFIKKEDKSQRKNFCLFKFIVYRPKFQEQIEKLDFTYLSFALLFNRKQFQVLLNSLAICKLKSISKTSINIVSKVSDGYTKRDKQYLEKVEIPFIEMEIVENIIKPYFSKSQLEKANFSNAKVERKKLPKSIINYLTVIDIIKNHKCFDIPLALQYSGHFEEAYLYFQQLLRAEQALPNRNIRKIYDLQSRLATLLQKMQRNQQALNLINKALETCKQIRVQVKNMALKDHLALTYKMIEKSSYILQENDYYHESIDKINQQLEILKFKYDHADRQVRQQRSQLGIIYYVRDVQGEKQDEKIKKKLYRFHSAQYLLLRGMIKFKQGLIHEARQDVVQSKNVINEVLESIGYEDLKTETFYIQFILHFIFDENVKWDTDDYFKKKRITNIASATAIFGGQHKIAQLKAGSTDFQQQITKFIKGYEQAIVQKNNNLMEGQVPEKINMKALVQTIEQSLIMDQPQSNTGRLKIDCELQNKVRQFFIYFKQILNDHENPIKKAIDQFQCEFQKILIEDIPKDQMINSIMTSQARLLYCKDEIINCVLRDWELTYVKEETRFQIQKKMDELIFLKKKINRKEVQSHIDRITPQQFKSYCAQNIKQIKSFITRCEFESHYFPQIIKDKAYHQLAKHQQNIGNQQKALELINHMITTSTLINQKKKFKILNLVETYLLKIGIIFNEADIDFQHGLLYRAVQKIAQIRKYQKDLLGKCKRNLDHIKLIIKEYEARYQQQINDKIKGHKIKKGLIKKNIEIKLWDLRMRIYDIFFARQSIAASKKVNLQKIATLQAQIKSDLNKHEMQQYEAELHQASSFLHYILHRFDFSFSNLKEALRKMKISNNHKKIKVFTKLFFWFAPKARQKLQDEQSQLKRLYRQYAASPSYWRICLAYHFYFRRTRPSSFPLTRCLKQIKQTSSYKCHHSIIQTCEHTMYKSFLSETGVEDQQQDEIQEEDCVLNPQSRVFENFEPLLQESQKFMRSMKEIMLPEPIEINQIYIELKKQHNPALSHSTNPSFMMSTRSSIQKKH